MVLHMHSMCNVSHDSTLENTAAAHNGMAQVQCGTTCNACSVQRTPCNMQRGGTRWAYAA
jgi:hypothetical protein